MLKKITIKMFLQHLNLESTRLIMQADSKANSFRKKGGGGKKGR